MSTQKNAFTRTLIYKYKKYLIENVNISKQQRHELTVMVDKRCHRAQCIDKQRKYANLHCGTPADVRFQYSHFAFYDNYSTITTLANSVA